MATAAANSASSTTPQAQAPSSRPISTSRETLGATSPSCAATWRQKEGGRDGAGKASGTERDPSSTVTGVSGTQPRQLSTPPGATGSGVARPSAEGPARLEKCDVAGSAAGRSPWRGCVEDSYRERKPNPSRNQPSTTRDSIPCSRNSRGVLIADRASFCCSRPLWPRGGH